MLVCLRLSMPGQSDVIQQCAGKNKTASAAIVVVSLSYGCMVSKRTFIHSFSLPVWVPWVPFSPFSLSPSLFFYALLESNKPPYSVTQSLAIPFLRARLKDWSAFLMSRSWFGKKRWNLPAGWKHKKVFQIINVHNFTKAETKRFLSWTSW